MSVFLKSVLSAAAACVALGSAPASAAIVVGNTTPTFVKINNPAGLVNVGNQTSAANGLNQNRIYGFDEKKATLLSSLTVNLGGLPSNNTTLAAGRGVLSHLIFFDPRFIGVGLGTVTFSRNILGVIRTTAGQVATDAALGASGVGYVNVANRGLENIDVVLLGPGTKTLSIAWSASNPGDTLRVLTAVPEPATWALMILGFGMIGGALRSRPKATTRFA